MSVEEVKESKVNQACKNCGAELNYEPGSEFLKCAYCGYREEIKTAQLKSNLELDLQKHLSQLNGQAFSEQITMVHCNSCGADQHIGEDVKTENCVFCGSNIELQDQTTEEWINPGAILPFYINKNKANKYFEKWVKGLWFAPNKFKKATLSTSFLEGVYIPYWTFDAQMQVEYSGERGVYYYENKQIRVQVNGKTTYRNEQVRKTRWFPVSGEVNGFIDDTLILASEKRKVNIDSKVSNWDLSKAKAFDAKYLAGYITEKYTIPLKSGHVEAQEYAGEIAMRWAKQDIGGDTQRLHQWNNRLSQETFKHILLPLYISNYEYAGQKFPFQINGQTGQLSGKRPYSMWKIIGAIGVCIVLIVVGIYLVK